MTKETTLLFALAVFSGCLGGIHVPINGALGQRISSPVVATLTFYSVAWLLIAAVALLQFDRSVIAKLAATPWWYYVVPGLISVVVVGSSTFLIPRLGAINVFVVAFTASMVVRSVISHFGWLASPVDPINGAKILGAVLLLSGAILVVKS